MKKNVIILSLCWIAVAVVVCSLVYKYYKTNKFVNQEALSWYQENPGQNPPTSAYEFVFILERIEETHLPLSWYVDPRKMNSIIFNFYLEAANRAGREKDKNLANFNFCMANEMHYVPLKVKNIIENQYFCNKKFPYRP